MISLTGLPILISLLFSASVVGLYGFMLRILKAPLAILASSLGQVFYQEFSSKVAKKQPVMRLFVRTSAGVALLILPFFILLMIWGPDIFAWVFSEKWRESGVYARYLSPWLFFSSVTSPVSQVPLTLNKVKTNMFLGFLNNLLVVLLFVVGAYGFHTAKAAFLAIGIVMPVYFIGLYFWYYQLIIKYEKGIGV